MRAASSEFPRWLRPLQLLRFVLATAGSIVVIALLILQSLNIDAIPVASRIVRPTFIVVRASPAAVWLRSPP